MTTRPAGVRKYPRREKNKRRIAPCPYQMADHRR
jgi:hypothetical protein